jgi:hypothetical protein
MDRHAHHEPMLAPSADRGADRAYAPGAESGERSARAPSAYGLDQHLVKPEVTRDEVVRGERMVAMPSRPEHGDRHFGLDYVLGAHIRREYVGSTDLITRFSAGSDFATDTCIRKTGKNPKTGERYLEEVAFEVVHTQTAKDIHERAEDVTTRGVRRFFAIFVKKGQVAEWSAKEGAFVVLDPEGEIADRTLATPVRVRALLDAAEADNGVARALLAKNNPVLRAEQERKREEGLQEGVAKGLQEGVAKGLQEGVAKGLQEGVAKGLQEGVAKGLQEGVAKGLIEGKASAVIAVLEARGLEPDPEVRRTIRACADVRKLDAWLRRAATASSANAVLKARRRS